METKQDNIICISCAIFTRELQWLKEQGRLEMEIKLLDSKLHMKPEVLRQKLEDEVAQQLARGRRVILVYGDCQSHMIEMEGVDGVVRTKGINCCEILLGTEQYKRLRKEGCFFLLHEWTCRWQALFKGELGLSKENACGIMSETHTKIMYLDSGIADVPTDELEAFSDYCGLPFEVMQISPDHLLEAVSEAALRLKNAGVQNGNR